jgi:NitT/TauT family transport system substrate-binding protein
MIERRAFVKGLAAAGSGLLGHARAGFAAEPPPETTRLRISQQPSICVAPQFIVKELLRPKGSPTSST